MKKSALLCLLLQLLPAIAAAAVDFTFARPGARANSLGGAFSTVEDDAYAFFYNPADLTTLTNLETRFETARRLTPAADEGELSMVYVRPVPDTENKVAGLGYYAVRQGGNSADYLVMGTGNQTVVKYLQRPIYYGTGLKLVRLQEAGQGHLGLGFDAGIKLSAASGFKTALVLSDFMLGLGRSMTTFTLGNSYQVKNTLLLADLKARGSYSEVFLGAEQNFFNGLLQARAGKGLALAGGHYLALGLGFNLLPWTVDLAWSIPWAGYHENSGYYGFNVGYRFGAKSFTEKLVGDASREAESLRTQIDDLRVQRSNLENAISTAKVNKGIAETDMVMMQGRMRDMEQTLKDLQVQVLEQQYKKENPKPVKRYVPPPPEKWPKLHKTAPGETLRSIASKYYGNPGLWERIYEANEKNISKGLPVEGSILTIPPPPPVEK
jgi:phage tail protein X/uncharacterized coiled-coil protein SlyX